MYTVFGAVADCGTKILLQVIDYNKFSRELNSSYLYVYNIKTVHENETPFTDVDI